MFLHIGSTLELFLIIIKFSYYLFFFFHMVLGEHIGNKNCYNLCLGFASGYTKSIFFLLAWADLSNFFTFHHFVAKHVTVIPRYSPTILVPSRNSYNNPFHCRARVKSNAILLFFQLEKITYSKYSPSRNFDMIRLSFL